MFGTVTNERLLSCGYRQVFAFDRFRFEFRHLMTELVAAVSFLLLSTTSFAVTANAVEATSEMTFFSALRDYVQLIESGRKLTGNSGSQTSAQNSNDERMRNCAASLSKSASIDLRQLTVCRNWPVMQRA